MWRNEGCQVSIPRTRTEDPGHMGGCPDLYVANACACSALATNTHSQQQQHIRVIGSSIAHACQAAIVHAVRKWAASPRDAYRGSWYAASRPGVGLFCPVLTSVLLSFYQQQLYTAVQPGGELLVGRLVAKRFGSYPELFRGKVGYYAPRLCPQAWDVFSVPFDSLLWCMLWQYVIRICLGFM